MPYSLLSEPIRKYIRDKGWEQLRPIQAVGIAKIIESDDNFILASRTASGKTEAAFLPILSKVNFNDSGVQVLYISPLIALINDQFNRVEELCKYLDVTVTKWHGEANKASKERIIKNPQGIVLITPESLEAMFINKPYNVKLLFSKLKYVVIDEIHSFIGTDRGVQLKSILSRIQYFTSNNFSIVGLSATIGSYDEAKKFTGKENRTKVLLDRKGKEIQVLFRYFKKESQDLPLELLKDLYIETKDNKVLIFPNSRGIAEEISVKLRKLSDLMKGHSNYFSHHSSVDKEVREYVEDFAKNNKRQNFCISCTSTLELGIDIGTVDEVIQVDATNNISSLIQRVGRSGRRDGEISKLFLYATNQWSLLQSIACWLLYIEGFIEPPQPTTKSYDILIHQTLSITKGYSGIRINDLKNQIKENFAFDQIETSEIEELISHLIKIDFLEKIGNEVVIGIEGEKIVNSREFYSVFKSEENFKVVHASNTIGEIPFSPQIVEDQNILLSAKIWKIKFVDHKAKKIEVVPAKDGKKPIFYGGGTVVHQMIREKMIQVLFDKAEYDFLDGPSIDELQIMMGDFSCFYIKDYRIERPLLVSEKHLQLFTFTGTKVNRTLKLLFNVVGLNNTLNDESSSFEFDDSKDIFYKKWDELIFELKNIDIHIISLLNNNSSILDFSKWGLYLPEKYKIELLKDKYFDLKQTEIFLKDFKLVENNLQGMTF